MAQEANETLVYVPSEEEVWQVGAVVENLGTGKFSVRLRDEEEDPSDRGSIGLSAGKDTIMTVNLKSEAFASAGLSTLPLVNEETTLGVDDMCKLESLHEPAILMNLRSRFFSFRPYTFTGDITIAMNPFQWLDIYKREDRARYSQQDVDGV